MPYNVVLNSACNIRCEYCFAKEVIDSSSNEELSLDDFQLILSFLKKSGRNDIGLLGGEPTLHSNFLQIIELLKENKFDFSVKSNALWNNKIKERFAELSSERVSFLLNINRPSFYTSKQWQRINDNLNSIIKFKKTLSINIDRPEFEYEYILEMAEKFNVKYIRWSFAHPIFDVSIKEIKQKYLEIGQYKETAGRILEFIRKAAKQNIMTLGDHSVILCMFNSEEIKEIHNLGGELNSKCEGTLDILQNLQVIFCLPMNSFFPKVFLKEFNSLDEIDVYFENRIKPLRIIEYPFNECKECQYASKDECHGGCLAHRNFTKDVIAKYADNWTIEFLLDKKLSIPQNISFNKIQNNTNNIWVEDLLTGNQSMIDYNTFEFINKFNGQKKLTDIIIQNDLYGENNGAPNKLLINFIEKARKYGLLELIC